MPRKPPRSTEERLVRAQKSMMPGTLGGRVASAAPMALDVTRLDPRLRSRPPSPKVHSHTRLGPINAAITGGVLLPNDTGTVLYIQSVRASLGTAPTSQPVVVDVLVDGTSIFAGTYPQVATGATVGAPVSASTRGWPPGASLRVDVTQGDAAAADLHVAIAVA